MSGRDSTSDFLYPFIGGTADGQSIAVRDGCNTIAIPDFSPVTSGPFAQSSEGNRGIGQSIYTRRRVPIAKGFLEFFALSTWSDLDAVTHAYSAHSSPSLQ